MNFKYIIFNLISLVIAFAAQNVDYGKNGAFIWQGFTNFWLRKEFGFAVPHRISKLQSYIYGEDFPQDSLNGSSATLIFGDSTGVDGNYMKPVSRHQTIFSENISVNRYSFIFSWTDNSQMGEFPNAESRITADMDYAVLLSGFNFNTHCDDSKQHGILCNSDGIWPYKFNISITNCALVDKEVVCSLNGVFNRGWTPNEGGFPILNITKAYNERIDFYVEIFYQIIYGDKKELKVTQLPQYEFKTVTDVKITPFSVYSYSVEKNVTAGTAVGITGFQFELFKFGEAKKLNNLGRYILGLDFEAFLFGYDPNTGNAQVEFRTQVDTPVTVVNSGVNYQLDASIIQLLGENKQVTTTKLITGNLCIDSTGEAPIWSEWKKCGTGDKGREQSSDFVMIYGDKKRTQNI